MANSYQITILNESGAPQSYILFAAVPSISGGPAVFSNVFMAAPTIASRGDGSSRTSFTITRQFYGICGTSVQNLATGVLVATSDYEAVTLGTGNTPGTSLNFTTTGGTSFSLPLPTPTAPATAYTISTDSSFEIPNINNTFIGMGATNMQGDVVPVATFLAQPSQTYNIYPVVKYYIGTGTFVAGQIINVQQIGTTQLCDFTDTPYPSLTFVHGSNGQYSPVTNYEAKEIKRSILENQKIALLGSADGDDTTLGTNGTGNGLNLTETQLAQDLQRVFLKLIHKANGVAA